MTTGTLKFKARFDNKDQALFPNQFVNVHLLADTLKNVVLAPSAAIQFGNNGTFVYKLDGDKKVKVQPLVVGDTDGENTVIKEGLVAGDRVVLEGTDRLKDGSEIEVVNASSEVPTTPTEHLQGKPAAKGRPVLTPARRKGRFMNPSRLFILRPVATTLSMLAIVLAGIIAYRLLPVSALPQVDYPTIRVMTLYPGASPDVMTSAVTAPLERQFGQMPGLTQMASTSSGGASVLTLRFNLDINMDVAEQQVQAAINAATNLLPKDLLAPPVYNKVNPADTPVLTLAITSKTMLLPKLNDLVDTRMAQKIAQISGVGMVSIAGGQRQAVRIKVNPEALAANGLNLSDVRALIAASNVNQPKGNFDGPTRVSMLDANDQLVSPEQYAELILAYNNAPLRQGCGADRRRRRKRAASPPGPTRTRLYCSISSASRVPT